MAESLKALELLAAAWAHYAECRQAGGATDAEIRAEAAGIIRLLAREREAGNE